MGPEYIEYRPLVVSEHYVTPVVQLEYHMIRRLPAAELQVYDTIDTQLRELLQTFVF